MVNKPDNRRELFCKEYLVDFNATQAAIRAGYSKRTAGPAACRLLKNVKIQQTLSTEIAKRAEELEFTAGEAIARLVRIARSNIKNYVSFGPGGVRLKDSEDIPDDLAYCIEAVSETETKEGGSRRFKLCDKLRALELLGKHLILFDRNAERDKTSPEELQAILKKFMDRGYRPRNPIVRVESKVQELPEKGGEA